MGWASGSDLMVKVVRAIRSQVDDKFKRQHIYTDLIDAFEDHDCDTLDEALGEDPAFDEAYAAKYPDIE